MGLRGIFDPVLFFIWGWGHVRCFLSLGIVWHRTLGVDIIKKEPRSRWTLNTKALEIVP